MQTTDFDARSVAAFGAAALAPETVPAPVAAKPSR